MLFGDLARAEGWSKAEEALITALGVWLNGRPGVGELKPYCERVVSRLLGG